MAFLNIVFHTFLPYILCLGPLPTRLDRTDFPMLCTSWVKVSPFRGSMPWGKHHCLTAPNPGQSRRLLHRSGELQGWYSSTNLTVSAPLEKLSAAVVLKRFIQLPLMRLFSKKKPQNQTKPTLKKKPCLWLQRPVLALVKHTSISNPFQWEQGKTKGWMQAGCCQAGEGGGD